MVLVYFKEASRGRCNLNELALLDTPVSFDQTPPLKVS